MRWESFQRVSSTSEKPTVTCSGIRSVLEQAFSDILILLDCCGAGGMHEGVGNGVTELIAVCTYDSRANGVGPFSFTNSLIADLRVMALKGKVFSAAVLFGCLYERMQSHIPQGLKERALPSATSSHVDSGPRISISVNRALRS